MLPIKTDFKFSNSFNNFVIKSSRFFPLLLSNLTVSTALNTKKYSDIDSVLGTFVEEKTNYKGN